MDFRKPISSQYLAALAMLKQAILACPDALWTQQDERTAFWRIAYHALFYTHLYAQESEETFRPWPGERAAYRMDAPPSTSPAEYASKDVVLDYLAFCQDQVVANVATMRLEGPSGFDWLPFTKFEAQLYSIRHIQQHAGELMERLGPLAGELPWVGKQPQPS
jgi:hypothetical protein